MQAPLIISTFVNMLRLISICFIITLSFTACYYDKADKLYPNASACDTAGMTYITHVKPIIKTNCLDKGCHTTANPTDSIILETYANVKSIATSGKLINALKYTAGGSKNMPPTGKLSDCEIQRVDAWIKRGSPEN